MFSSHWTTLTVRKFKRFAVQHSVWTKPKSWTIPCSVKYFSRSEIRSVACEHIHTRRHVAATLRGDKSLRVYRSGDKLLQQVARQVPVTNRSVRTPSGEFKSLSQQHNFVASTSLTNSVWLLIFCDLLPWQNSVAETKILTKLLQYTKSDLSQRRVAATCCRNLSLDVFRP